MNSLKKKRNVAPTRERTEEEKKEFAEIYEKYYQLVFKFLFKVFKNVDEAEEIAEETFTDFYTRPDTYNKKEYSIKSFLLLSAKCKAITYIKKENRRTEIVHNKRFELMSQDDGSESYEKKIEKYDENNAIYEALEFLRPNYRDAIIEVFLNRKSYKEAAEALGISEANLKVTLHRAKKKLEEELIKKGFKDYFINFFIIGLIVLGLTCTCNMAIKKLFKDPTSYSYNDKALEVNIEILERHKHILDALNIVNDGNIKTRYISVNRENQDVLHIYNDKFELRIFDNEILDYAVNYKDASIIDVDEAKIKELDNILYGDEIREVKTVANIDYKMINVIVSDEEYRIYIVSDNNKLLKIRNMEQYFIDNSIEFDKEDVSKIVKEEYGENIEIKSIELTQTKLNVLIDEGEKEEYHKVEAIDKYKDIGLAYKNFNFYLVWRVEIIERIDNLEKITKIYIDVCNGEILKNAVHLKMEKSNI